MKKKQKQGPTTGQQYLSCFDFIFSFVTLRALRYKIQPRSCTDSILTDVVYHYKQKTCSEPTMTNAAYDSPIKNKLTSIIPLFSKVSLIK